MSHLEIARTQGMKAGFRAYVQTLERSGLPTAQAKLDTIRKQGKRKAFAAYCADKGPDVLARPEIPTRISAASKAVVGRRTGRTLVVEEPAGLAAEIAAARARLAELEAEASKPVAKPKAARKPATVAKENLWRPWAIAKHGIPTKVGATFSYKGKRRTSTFKVTRVTTEGVYSVRA